LKQTTTGDTLADENNPIVLESIVFPEPVISVAIEPRSKADQEKMSQALVKLAEEDPTFKVRTDEETAQIIISGMGELHLEIIEALNNGPLAGYPVVDMKATLVDGSYHEVDSSEMAFMIAGSIGVKDGLLKAQPTLLEPVMKVEVVLPEEFMGDILGDLSARR